jgi:hypothetical protein
LIFQVTLANTGNIDITDNSVSLTGGAGGPLNLLNCTSSTGAVTAVVPQQLLVGANVTCYLQYTTVQEDLEVGEVSLNATATSTVISPSVSDVFEVPAVQVVGVEATYTAVDITGAESSRYTAPGEVHSFNLGGMAGPF